MQSVKLRSALLSRGKQSEEEPNQSTVYPTRRPRLPESKDTELTSTEGSTQSPYGMFSVQSAEGILDSCLHDVYAGADLEVTETGVEIEMPVWITVIHLAQLLSPDLFSELEPALSIGADPIVGVNLTPDATESIIRICELIWGKTDIVIPILCLVQYSVDARGLTCPGKMYSRIQPCPTLPVHVQRLEVSSCSPYENRILNAKQSYARCDPISAVITGLRVASNRYSRLLPGPRVPQSSSTDGSSTQLPGKKRSCVYSWVRSRK